MQRGRSVLLTISTSILALFALLALAQEPSPAGGGWLELNGTDSFVLCPDDDSLDKNLEDFTIEVWIYPRRKPERGEWWIIAAKPGTYELACAGPTEEFGKPSITEFGIVFTVYEAENSYGTINAQKDQKHGPPWFPDNFGFNEWHHITAKFAEAEWGLYIDSKAICFGGPRDFSAPNTRSALYVGGIGDRERSYFHGRIDELRISGVARQVRADVKINRFDADRETLGLWHFDEPEGATSFQDSSGSGNTLFGRGGGFAVASAGKLATIWAGIKSGR